MAGQVAGTADAAMPSASAAHLPLKIAAEFVTSAADARRFPGRRPAGGRARRPLERRQVEPDQRARRARRWRARAPRPARRGWRTSTASRAGRAPAVLPRRSAGVRLRARRRERQRASSSELTRGVLRRGQAARGPRRRRCCSSTRGIRASTSDREAWQWLRGRRSTARRSWRPRSTSSRAANGSAR